MYRRNQYQRRKRKIHRLTGGICMAVILVAILLNQKAIMGWMNWMRGEQKDSGLSVESSQPEQRNPDEVLVLPEGETKDTMATEHIIQRKDAKPVGQPQVGKEETGSLVVQPQQSKENLTSPAVRQEEQDRLEKQKRQERAAMEIHGAYFSAGNVSSKAKVEQIIKRLEGTQINAVVVNVKDDTGMITFQIDSKLAEEIGAVSSQIWDINEMVRLFHDHGIYVIGRIVAFRDSILSVKKKEYAVQNLDGSVFYDKAGDTWMNPYNKDCWSYLAEIAAGAVKAGFDEIQFDYVRFSTQAEAGKVSFGKNTGDLSKTEIITAFIRSMAEQVHLQDAKLSADVFGTIINSEIDAKIVGQDYAELAKYLDYICPMIYPSHYGDGCYGLEVPDLQPYELILGALNDSAKKLMAIDAEHACAKVRPWLQDFTAKWKKRYQKYGTEQVEDQIHGVYDSGYTQWLLWNSSGNYSTMND